MKKLKVWLPLLFAVTMILGMLIGFRLYPNVNTGGFFKTGKLNRVQEVLDIINNKYVDTVYTDSMSQEAIDGMLAHLDPHSYFIPASDREEMNEDLDGNFEGIGVEFQILNDTVNVVNVLAGGPSDKAGLLVGDQFIKVNDSLVAGNGITGEKIKKMLKGPGASVAHLSMLRDHALKNFDVARGSIPLPALDAAYMLNRESGYIRINKFSRTTYQEFLDALQKLLKQGMKKLVLDIRDNGGGIVDEAVNMADEFLGDDELIVYTEGRKSPRKEYHARRPGNFETGKLILLVNEGTASASEILAGALQDWDRASIVGRRTFGKGLVQEPFMLGDGSELRLTIARYYTPLGRSIQKPYDKGREAYNDEVIERFHNGEALHGDTSTVHAGHVYKTPAGRVVYGGGGITPDVFVAFDTNRISKSITALYVNGTLGNFIYEYYIHHLPLFKQYKDASDFSNRFNQEEDVWKSLGNYVKKDSISLAGISGDDRRLLQTRIKALFARLVWHTEGYFIVMNQSDPVMKKALELLENNSPMP
ncbi:MAG: S41 family peptidase [Bacteroidota bacterium]|nr:S41 family peptidase [Bacteroidota bacterium]MDP4211692.1 S41 family peptidase [Bacteroidota bacterium]